MLIIWLQGIWLPQHGYNFTQTPLWAGIYMLPLTAGMLVAGPTSGYLSDRFGARPFATGGMIGTAVGFALLLLLPIDFSYPLFALILGLIGVSMGMFASPNRAAVMNSLPPRRPGRRRRDEPDLPELGPGDVDRDLLHADHRRACRRRFPAPWPRAQRPRGHRPRSPSTWRHLPPVSFLFAAFLGYNPIQHLLGRARAGFPQAHSQATLTGRDLLPPPDLRPVPDRTARGVRVRDRGLPDRGGRIADARRPLPPRRRVAADRRPAARAAAITDRNPSERSSMQVEWYGQSAFRLTGATADGVHRSVRRPVRAGGAGNPVRLSADRGRPRRPAAGHPRASGPQRRGSDLRLAGDSAIDRGTARVADRRGGGDRLRAR